MMGSTITNPLTTEERLLLVEIIDALEQVNTSDQLVACLDNEVQALLPHGRFGCGVGKVGLLRISSLCILLNHFPREYVETHMRTPDGGVKSPLLSRWRKTRKPVLVQESNYHEWDQGWIARCKRWGLRNAAVHGLLDFKLTAASYFSFMDMPGELGEKHVYLLNRLVPHLHCAVVRAMATEQRPRRSPELAQVTRLSPRQKEILRLLHLGKTNTEIARTLSLSTHNVKYHVNQIFFRLNATNRTTAVARALYLNIIDP